ncbi:MAG: hypothetical protein WC004_03005 [Candidatus Absconditabacterales bacterium]
MVSILFTFVFTIASVVAGYNRRSIFKINLVQTILIMIIGCFGQADKLAAYDGLSIWIVLAGLFIVVWVLVYIVNKLCWFVGRIIRWMVDGAYTVACAASSVS